MGESELINFAELTAAIPGERATGNDPREDFSPTASYRTLKDARASVRTEERELLSGDGQAGAPPDWTPIVELSTKVLKEQAKDLEVAAWLLEGLTREYGFAGLRAGFQLSRELVEKYWEALYPMPDEEGVGRRVAALAALDATVPLWINTMPITEGHSGGPYSWFDYQQAVEIEQITDPDKKQKRLERGAAQMEQFKTAVGETPAAFYRALVADLAGCLEELAKLSTVLDGKCGADASPNFSQLRNALQSCVETVQNVAKEKLEAAAAEALTDGSGAAAQVGGGNGGAAGATAAAVGAIRNREGAFREIMRIAAYFKQTEPQSLVWYALEQVVRWGRMPLPDLLAEFVPEEARTRFGWIGIKGKAEGQTEQTNAQSSGQG